MAGAYFKRYRNGAKKMVAKGKTYGKKKARELVSLFADLSLSPTKPDASVVTRILAPTPDSQNEALLEPTAGSEVEQGAESADGDDSAKSERGQVAEVADRDEDKENRPRRKAYLGKALKESIVKNQTPTEISELTSLDFVENEVVDFRKFCKGWEKEFKLTKIGQGGFATVVKMELNSGTGQYSVWKLMPLKPSKGAGSRPYQNQTLIKDAVTEVKMLFALSDTDGFVQFRSAHVVKGSVPNQICKAHELWAKDLRSDDTWFDTKMDVEFPSKDQLWLLMEMTDAGKDLDFTLGIYRSEGTVFAIHETSDIFWGIAEALMRGEAQAEFEHRDLHLGNVCVKDRDEPLDLTAEHGIPRLSKYEVTLIDYTQSRLTLESGEVLATAVDDSIFRQFDEDPVAQRQYDVYRDMRDMVKREKQPGVSIGQMWKEYVPLTNVLWLRYMLKELMLLTRLVPVNLEERIMVKSLLDLRVKLKKWEYSSAREVVSGFLVGS